MSSRCAADLATARSLLVALADAAATPDESARWEGLLIDLDELVARGGDDLRLELFLWKLVRQTEGHDHPRD